MLQHIVLFKFPEPVVDDTFVAMTEFISTWSEEIPDLRAIASASRDCPTSPTAISTCSTLSSTTPTR